MMHDSRQRLFRRYRENPILTAADWPYFVNTVFNAGATRLASGETLLLCRVEDCTGLSHLCAARSDDGMTNWRIDDTPTMPADPTHHPEELWGIEDPRIIWIAELDQYAVVYTAYSERGPGVSLALTKDFRTFERMGMIFPPEDKDAALLPERVDGRWAMIRRPVPTVGGAHIWMSFSPDLVHWGEHTLILKARRGAWWDANKIGLCPPLIDTPKGWLMIYHGVKATVSGCIYRVGLALFDRKDPTKCLQRGIKWVMSPQTDYERSGYVSDVVFPCGCTIADDGDTIRLYYGAADTSVALATASIAELLDWLDHNNTPGDPAGDGNR